ncbi:MAG TPA: PEP-CTERM sorting domain-containing protein [Phycisphaerae bacterium]|nr:PEP-CTERM sorting domain-containing protein [Phycisphaerae bacterium]
MGPVKRGLLCMLGLATAVVAAPAQATVIHTWSGLSSAGVPVAFESHLTISGNTLTINLINDSPVHSQNPNDLLSSYYFDVVCNNVRPALTYVSATGDVWLTDQDAPDSLVTANANLKAVVAGDDTWQFRNMNAALSPFLGFGVGTVGNNGLTPNNFMGNIVDGLDYSLYKADASTANLDNDLLVLEAATFVFSGVSGCVETDIISPSAFGLGTAPDSLQYSPEPATLALLAFGGLALVRRRR